MKIKKFIALMLGTALSVGALSGCGANNTTTIDQTELENQIKAYLDANLDSYLDKYFDYGDDWGDYEQEPDRTQFSNNFKTIIKKSKNNLPKRKKSLNHLSKGGPAMAIIYYADDEQEIREIVSAFLRNDGHEVTTFENGDLLLAAFRQKP